MKEKKNPLEKFLDRTIVLRFGQLIRLIILCMGIGALIGILSFIIGVILTTLMSTVILFTILPYIITFKGDS